MPRGPKPTKALYIIGRVRIVQGKDGRGYRILWYERKRQRERTATTFEEAKLIAREEDARLDGVAARGAYPDTRFGELVLYAVDPDRHQWSFNWAERMVRYANIHVLPKLGRMRCSQISKEHLVKLLEDMAADGYSKHTIDKVRKVLGITVKEGVALGVWQQGRHPMLGVRTPGADGGRPDLDLIPTHEQVEALIERMADDREMYSVMTEVAAFTGLRWGELLAVRKSVIDLDAGYLTVNLVCVEEDSRGRFVFRKPSKSGAARTTVPPRRVPLESRLVERLGEWVEKVPTLPKGPHVDGEQPAGLLFQARNGNPLRRSWWAQKFKKHTSQIEGWPESATFHYLRHYCATRWINPPPAGLGIEVPTVSKMLGHANVSTTYEWYVDVDAEALERARSKLP